MAVIANQTIEVDLTPGGVTPFLYVSQGDYGTRSLSFNLSLNGEPYTVPSSVKSVKLEGATKTGNLFGVTCGITNERKTIVSSLTEDMTVDVGMDLCQLLFTDANGGKLGSANFFIVVEPSPYSTVVKYANVYWAELAKSWAVGGTGLRAGEDTNNAMYWCQNVITQAILSESWAVGGTGIREGEDTDNSKYYASIVNDVRPQIDDNTNEIAVLAAQIDQHITPSSQNVDEVVDARIAYDGTTYENLGDAVRSQVTVFGYIPGSEEIYFRHNT